MPNLSSDSKANEIVDVEKELQEAIQSYTIIADKRHLLQRQILELRIKIKDLDIPFEKVKHNKERITSELRIKRQEFWQKKGEGL
jgi:hypothetical protein